MSSTQRAIVTIGNFDGVHLGHQKLVRQAAERAEALGLRSLAITFDPHPEQILFPERRRTHLSNSDERRALLQACGIDEVWVCPFTIEIAHLEPEDFMRLVTDRQPMAELWVGADFALGRGRKGTISVLAEIGAALGWGMHMVPPLRLEGQVVSSTAIKTLLAAAAVRGASDLLGRTYSVSGELEADLFKVDPLRALPKPGVYDGQLTQDSATHDVLLTVLPAPGTIQLTTEAPHHEGPATLDFVRRAD
ncbi:MAG TPA: FAD synthetase family protein [Chloroflexota bacterium]|nr:FAD synthetase family protein [Chloroflexota bacterium]